MKSCIKHFINNWWSSLQVYTIKSIYIVLLTVIERNMVDEYRASTSTASTSRCDSIAGAFVRQAVEDDMQEIEELSTCIYKEHDWLASNFLKILQKEKNHIFVALIGKRVAGCVLCCVVDSDTTLVMWGMRIHPQFRRRNISYQLREAVFTLARDKYPAVRYERFTAITENNHVKRLRVELGFKKVMEFKVFSVLISDDIRKLLSKVLQEIIPKNVALKRFRKEDALNFVASIQKHNSNRMPTRTVVVEYVPYQLTHSNARVFFEDNDIILLDKAGITRWTSSDRIRNVVPGLKPSSVSSLSHGRVVQRVQHTHWETALYTDRPDRFRSHLLFQLREALHATKDGFVFTCFHDESNSTAVWEVLVQELCLRQLEDKQAISTLVIYERPVHSQDQTEVLSTYL